MTQKFKQVPVEGFTAEEVLALWHEGKLYRKAKLASPRELFARCQQETLDYVAAINEYATDEWKPYINNVWETIVCDKMFAPHLVMKQKPLLNRYYVTALVYNLQTLDVYQPVSQLKLHRKLEGITTRNTIFKNWTKYSISNTQRRYLRTILEDLLTSLKSSTLDLK